MMYYIKLFGRTFYIGLVAAVAVLSIYVAYNQKVSVDIYQAITTIMINEDLNSSYAPPIELSEYDKGNGIITDVTFVTHMLKTSLQTINTPQIQRLVVKDLAGKVEGIEEYNFSKYVSVSTYTESNAIYITAESQDKESAILIADSLVKNYKKVCFERLNADYIIIFESAYASDEPVNMPFKTGCVLFGAGTIIVVYAIIILVDMLARSEGVVLSWRIGKKKRKRNRTGS